MLISREAHPDAILQIAENQIQKVTSFRQLSAM